MTDDRRRRTVLYIGVTDNLERSSCSTGAETQRFTSKYNDGMLAYYETFD